MVRFLICYSVLRLSKAAWVPLVFNIKDGNILLPRVIKTLADTKF